MLHDRKPFEPYCAECRFYSPSSNPSPALCNYLTLLKHTEEMSPASKSLFLFTALWASQHFRSVHEPSGVYVRAAAIMPDPITTAGLAAGIETVTKLGSNFVARLMEDQGSVDNLPQSLKGLDVNLPVILETLERVKDHAADGKFGDETRAKVKGVIDSCHAQIKVLYEIIERVRPSIKDSVPERAQKAFLSVQHENEILRLRMQLAEHRSILIDHIIACSGLSQATDGGKRKIFSVPRERNPDWF